MFSASLRARSSLDIFANLEISKMKNYEEIKIIEILKESLEKRTQETESRRFFSKIFFLKKGLIFIYFRFLNIKFSKPLVFL